MPRRRIVLSLLPVVLTLAALSARCAAPDGAGGHHAVVGPDGGPDGGGPDEADAGFSDAGPADPDGGLAGLSPIDPQCADGQGPVDACWQEWLKIVRPTGFQPVQIGALGPGPWPADALVHLGGREGLTDPVVGVGVDTGQNQYAVSRGALFVRRAGEATFTRHARGADGLRDYPFLSVAGAGPGVAWVGHEGQFGTDTEIDPPEIRRSGDVDVVTLGPAGFNVQQLDTHNSNTPISGKFDHSRSIHVIEIPRRGAAAGEVFLGTEHGVVRYQGDLYADHVHVTTVGPDGSEHFGSTGGLAVAPDGTAWYANAWQVAGRQWAPRRHEWYVSSRWFHPSFVLGVAGTLVDYSGLAIDPAGDVWVVAPDHGLGRLRFTNGGRGASVERVAAPEPGLRDVAADLDGTLWIAASGGLWRYTPATGSWQRLAGVDGAVNDLFLDDTVTPRALYAATSRGVYVWRGN